MVDKSVEKASIKLRPKQYKKLNRAEHADACREFQILGSASDKNSLTKKVLYFGTTRERQWDALSP